MKEKLYPYIRMWGISLGSFEYYIENQVLSAKNEDAPSKAVFKDSASGTWITIDEVTNADLKHRIERAVKERYPMWVPHV